MPCFETSAPNHNGEGLAFLRAVLDGWGRTSHPTWPPSWTGVGHHSRQSSGPICEPAERRCIPLSSSGGDLHPSALSEPDVR